MLFNSFTFLVFFIAFFICYWFIFNAKLKWQNLLLLVGSYIFYGWWDYRFLGLLILTTISDFYSGILIEKKPQFRKYILGWTLTFNLGILAFYKYSLFFVNSIVSLFTDVSHKNWDSWLPSAIIPVGISFYTFQSISYVIDVYKDRIKASTSFLEYAAFIAFWPQLVAGPIERASALLSQIQTTRKFNYQNAVIGSELILWGLVKKILIADNCAPEVDRIFGNYTSLGSLELIYGVLLFSIQIYCDFSAYSEIARGCAKLLGFELMINFNKPYFASNIQDFWSRWHISLSTWFRDYVYIPLGGNRDGESKMIRNILMVFILSGIWHGANWTFLIWGLYHAILYFAYILFFKNKGTQNAVMTLFNIIFTQILVGYGWLIFRANDIGMVGTYTLKIFEYSKVDFGFLNAKILLSLVLLFSFEWYSLRSNLIMPFCSNKFPKIRFAIYSLLVLITLAYGNFSNLSFIYFNF